LLIKARCEPASPDVEVDTVAIVKCLNDAAAPAAEKWARAHWNASALTFAAATAIRLENSRFSQRRWAGLALWLQGSLAVGEWGQVVVQGSYLDSRLAAADSLDYKAMALGGRLLVGGRKLNGFAEASREFRFDRVSAVKKDDGRWSAGVEFLVTNGLWL